MGDIKQIFHSDLLAQGKKMGPSCQLRIDKRTLPISSPYCLVNTTYVLKIFAVYFTDTRLLQSQQMRTQKKILETKKFQERS